MAGRTGALLLTVDRHGSICIGSPGSEHSAVPHSSDIDFKFGISVSVGVNNR